MRYFGQSFYGAQHPEPHMEGGGELFEEEEEELGIMEQDALERQQAAEADAAAWTELEQTFLLDSDRNVELIVAAEQGSLTDDEAEEAVRRGILTEPKKETKKKKRSSGGSSQPPSSQIQAHEDPKWYDVREWGGKQWGIAGGATVGLGLAIWGIIAIVGDD
jgi:hypothetical protein